MTISRRCNKYKQLKTKKNVKQYGSGYIEGGKNLKNLNGEQGDNIITPGVVDELSNGLYKLVTPIAKSTAKSIATGINSFANNLNVKETEFNKNNNFNEQTKEIPGLLGLGYNSAQNVAVNVIDSMNDIIDKNKNQQTIIGAVSRTADIGKDIIEQSVDVANKTLNSGEMANKIEDTSGIAAEVIDNVVDNLDKPLNKFANKIGKASANAASGVASGLVKVASDSASAIPGLNVVIAGLDMANDVASTAASVVEATKNSVNAVSELTNEISDIARLKRDKLNIRGGSKDIHNYKKYVNEKYKIINRTNKSIDEFINNKNINIPVYNKTFKKLFKNRVKSKKVRFYN